MSAFKNDGSVVYGSKVLTLSPNSGGAAPNQVVYVADNINLTRASGSILRTNEIAEPSGRVGFKNDVDSFDCTLQFASSATLPPVLGWECTVTFDATSGAEVWYVDKLGVAYVKDGETKINVTLVEKLV